MTWRVGLVLFSSWLLLGGTASAKAQSAATDPNLANPAKLVTAKPGSYTITGLVTHLARCRA
jgi:hypothetical protein